MLLHNSTSHPTKRTLASYPAAPPRATWVCRLSSFRCHIALYINTSTTTRSNTPPSHLHPPQVQSRISLASDEQPSAHPNVDSPEASGPQSRGMHGVIPGLWIHRRLLSGPYEKVRPRLFRPAERCRTGPGVLRTLAKSKSHWGSQTFASSGSVHHVQFVANSKVEQTSTRASRSGSPCSQCCRSALVMFSVLRPR